MVEHNSKDENYTEAQVYFKPIIQTKKGSSKFYRALTQKSEIPKGVAKWEMLKDNPDWKQVFLKLKATTNDPRLIWLQYRIIHNILTTNKSVSKFKHDQSEKCSFCGIQSESIVHLFGECNIIMVFWNKLQQIINSRCNVTEQLALNNSSILLGLDPTQTQNKVIDQMISYKSHTWSKKKKPKRRWTPHIITTALLSDFCLRNLPMCAPRPSTHLPMQMWKTSITLSTKIWTILWQSYLTV